MTSISIKEFSSYNSKSQFRLYLPKLS